MSEFCWTADALPVLEQHIDKVVVLSVGYLMSIYFYIAGFHTKYTLITTNVSGFQTVFKKEKILNQSFVKNLERVWNFAFSIFSCTLFCGISSQLLNEQVRTQFLEFDLTRPMAVHLWIYLYVLTKPLEYIDTLFLMVQCKKVTTLHWSHHLITTLITWYLATNQSAYEINGFLFAFTNLFVHAVMYMYYFLTSFSRWKASVQKYAYLVTLLQISQFVICLLFIIKKCVTQHDFSLLTVLMPLFMYSYYLYMFSMFFFRKYVISIGNDKH